MTTVQARVSREKFNQLLAPQFFAKHSLAVPVLTVKVKAMFSKIDSNERRVVHDGLRFRMSSVSVTYPVRRGGPCH